MFTPVAALWSMRILRNGSTCAAFFLFLMKNRPVYLMQANRRSIVPSLFILGKAHQDNSFYPLRNQLKRTVKRYHLHIESFYTE